MDPNYRDFETEIQALKEYEMELVRISSKIVPTKATPQI